ncbi:1-aminocyclopropane-1-carboxylate deaminase/D-cysteine desulfhydrase [Flavobacterium jejuense]|uniref:1-aminocyclopropane-1-carboxylate deaminase/D-cysteine desulfhydrase n=1 Tax=Flavobacterium jejuense TaxID=1544455 RepID=A0ABX0INM1_9FLAO|nr:pyridoxal-phosphate dependent enzyme [Flavobacterium jejuense]NHN25385.1 1-aminocyclopropane-1-carboxylate deaminase/D-cysteine desulfhydrase [Flavobacterium jejuense]
MNQKINIALPNNIEIYIKREDLLHPYISGNKFRKLKYNVRKAIEVDSELLITFGGAYSNHILATAAAGREYGIATLGVIRGEELYDKIFDNPTLSLARKFGMQFQFVSREVYSKKEEVSYIEDLLKTHNKSYILPEGGTNDLAIQGCEEILTDEDVDFDYVCCAVGTGGTVSGIINASNEGQKIIGFSALKGDFLSDVICKFVTKSNWNINNEYHFGGYGKVTDELITFLNDFYDSTLIPLDPIYTGKMVYGVLDMIQKNKFSNNCKILLIHTGGLQGIKGVNKVRLKKNKELLKYV